MFTEIRLKRGLCYAIGCDNDMGEDYGYFSVFCNTRKKNLLKVRKLILNEINKLKNVTEKDVKVAKSFLEGDYALKLEDNQVMADILAYKHLQGLDYLTSLIEL